MEKRITQLRSFFFFLILANRVDSKKQSVQCDEQNKLLKEDTLLSKTFFGDSSDYFLISEMDDGTIILGSKFFATELFSSTTIMGDGTFRTAPKGYFQNYILWFVLEDKLESDTINRHKAFPAIYFLMKSKTEAAYKRAFAELEKYR